MPDPTDYASKPLTWLIQCDRVAAQRFAELCGVGLFDEAVALLHEHLHRTERVRRGLDRGGPPTFGTGPAPDLEVAWEALKLTYLALVRPWTDDLLPVVVIAARD